MIGKKNTVAKLSELEASTKDYFEKLPGYDTLRMILAKSSILVEGPSDELIIQRAYLDLNGNLPIEDGIDVIAVRGLSFKRFLDIAALLKIITSVVTDNDGDYQKNVIERYESYTTNTNIKIYGSENEAYKTLEPQIVNSNELALLNSILETNFADKPALIDHMMKNKTDCALKIFNSDKKIVFPEYVTNAITREE